MLADLKAKWSSDMTWGELAAFCHDMTEKRQRIRGDRSIKPIRKACHECGGSMVPPPISIRSALFALRKINVIDEPEFKKLDREWSKYRKANNLDAYGNSQES